MRTLIRISLFALLSFGLCTSASGQTPAGRVKLVRQMYEKVPPLIFEVAEPVRVIKATLYEDGGSIVVELKDAKGKEWSMILDRKIGSPTRESMFVSYIPYSHTRVLLRGPEEAALYGILLRWQAAKDTEDWTRASVGAMLDHLDYRFTADAPDAAERVVERAIKEHGGKKELARLRAAELAYDFKGSSFPIVADRKLEYFDVKVREIYNLPNQIKKSIQGVLREEGMTKNEPFRIAWAVDGTKIWVRHEDGKIEFIKGASSAEANFRPLQIFETLARYDTFDWRLADDVPVDKRLTAVRAKDPKQPGVETIFLFNKETGLLERTRAVRTLPNSTRPIVGEVTYSDYKEVNGATLPMRQAILLDGKRMVEMHITEIRFLDKVDPKAFAPPDETGQGQADQYLTPNGHLKERLVLRDEGGFAGRGTGIRWEIETDGAWKHVAKDGTSFITTEGRLGSAQLQKLAGELARYDLLSLPREMRHDPKVIVADGFNVAVSFGKERWVFNAIRGFKDLPAVDLQTPQGRFAGIVRAIQESIRERSEK